MSRKARSAFKGYRGFPATICTSINEEVVHGIPSAKRRLREGDIIGLDLGCIVDGYYADCAITLPVGRSPPRAQELLDVTRESLDKAIVQCRVGNRLGDVSHAVQSHCESHGFGVVRAFVGHGIGRALHEEPQVPNFGEPGRGPLLKAGMVLAIEPMVTMGSLGGARAGGPVDGGDRGREPGRALRAHHRDHRTRSRCADRGVREAA